MSAASPAGVGTDMDMHPADVNAALRKRGGSQAAIARAEQVHRASVCKVINGRERSRRIEAAIARAAGLPLAAIWPTRYRRAS